MEKKLHEKYILCTLKKGKLAPLKSVFSKTSVGSERRNFFEKYNKMLKGLKQIQKTFIN